MRARWMGGILDRREAARSTKRPISIFTRMAMEGVAYAVAEGVDVVQIFAREAAFAAEQGGDSGYGGELVGLGGED